MSESIKIENTSDAAVYLPHKPGKDGAFSNDVTIVPRAKREELTDEKTGEKRTRKVFGTATMEAALWDRLKTDKVVATYLANGTLRVAGSSGPPTAANTTPAGNTRGSRS